MCIPTNPYGIFIAWLCHGNIWDSNDAEVQSRALACVIGGLILVTLGGWAITSPLASELPSRNADHAPPGAIVTDRAPWARPQAVDCRLIERTNRSCQDRSRDADGRHALKLSPPLSLSGWVAGFHYIDALRHRHYAAQGRCDRYVTLKRVLSVLHATPTHNKLDERARPEHACKKTSRFRYTAIAGEEIQQL